LRTTPARKPRTECCCQSVAVMIAAIVAPAGIRSIATIRLCFVGGRGADLDEAGADLARDAALRIFRAVERVVAFGLDLGFVTGFSEVYAAPSAASPQPRPGKSPGRARPRSQLSRSKSTQQCSDQARKPVNSEPDNCSSLGLLGRRQAARTVDPDSTIRRFESSHPASDSYGPHENA
jgi:hypothetical protein